MKNQRAEVHDSDEEQQNVNAFYTNSYVHPTDKAKVRTDSENKINAPNHTNEDDDEESNDFCMDFNDFDPDPETPENTKKSAKQSEPHLESRKAKDTSTPEASSVKQEKRKAADDKYKPKKQLEQILQAMDRGLYRFQEKKIRVWSGKAHPGNEAAVLAYNAFRTLRDNLDPEDDNFDKYRSKCAEIVEELKTNGDYAHATDLFLKLQSANPFAPTSKPAKRKGNFGHTPSSARIKRTTTNSKPIIDISDEEEQDESVQYTPTKVVKKLRLTSKVNEDTKKRIHKRLDTLVERFVDDVKDLIDEVME